MEENNPSKQGDKPFSVLEKFRQLKKEKEQLPSEKNLRTFSTAAGTVFRASTSSPNQALTVQVNEEAEREDFESRRGKVPGNHNFRANMDIRASKRVAAELHQGQKEYDVGITEYITDGPGFHVILKHRYTDFHVNEIDSQGRIVKLTSTEIPKEESEPETLSEEEDPSIISPEQWALLRNIIEKETDNTVDIDVTSADKDQRQRIHKAVKKRFGVHVFSNTKSVQDKKIIQIGWASSVNTRRSCNWPRGRPEYLHFVLLKENMDMTEVVNLISRFTLIKPNKFGYAGTKDKRAVTTQQMCARRVDVNRFKHCHKLRGVALGNYSYKWNNLRLGDLSGNQFRIVLRNVKANDEIVQDAIDKFKKTGFINYFGLQRFGQSALVPTYFIGKAILKDNWKLAVELILKPRPGESCFRDVKEAREIWWNTKNAKEALKPLTRKDKSIEGKILLGLKKHGPNAYQNAFDNLPKHTVTMYLHSYQSLIWNKVVSRRIREFGLKVLPGDLVKVNSSLLDDQDCKPHEESKNNDSDLESEEGEADGFAKIQVRALNPDEALSTSIYDILYPLPGDDIRFPNNEISKWYTELLEEDGHSMDCFRKVNKKYGMYGAYRNMVNRADDVRWWTLGYSSPDDDLLLSDLEILKGDKNIVSDPDASYKAVILEFNLNVCSYATMAIREMTKCDTSTSNQAMLTNQAREEDQMNKKLKLEKEHEQDLDMETELFSGSHTSNENGIRDQSKNVSMHGESSCDVVSLQTLTANGKGNEEGDINKREAEADNIINKYLESSYH